MSSLRKTSANCTNNTPADNTEEEEHPVPPPLLSVCEMIILFNIYLIAKEVCFYVVLYACTLYQLVDPGNHKVEDLKVPV